MKESCFFTLSSLPPESPCDTMLSINKSTRTPFQANLVERMRRAWFRTSCWGVHCTSLRWTSSAVPVNHYARLGLDGGHSLAEGDIKAAYRRKVLTCHPDLVEEKEKRSAEAEFRRVSESYNILMDAEKRRALDAAQELEKKATKLKSSYARSASKKSSAFAAPSSARKKPFLRRDADEAFVDAFEGKTVEEILFRERFRRRNGHADRTEPTPHAEVLQRVMDQAVKRFVEKGETKYGRAALKNATVHKYRPVERAPAGSHIPFMPFHGMKLPEGVTAPKVPQMGATSQVIDETIVAVTELEPPKKPTRTDLELANPLTRSSVMRKMAQDHSMRANEGQLYSYHRPF